MRPRNSRVSNRDALRLLTSRALGKGSRASRKRDLPRHLRAEREVQGLHLRVGPLEGRDPVGGFEESVGQIRSTDSYPANASDVPRTAARASSSASRSASVMPCAVSGSLKYAASPTSAQPGPCRAG